jgi:hypothetical protein
MLSRTVNFVAFQVGWFASVLGAAYGRPWLGPVVVSVLLAIHLWNVADQWATARLLLTVGLIGFVVDSLLGYAGLLLYRDSPLALWLCPPWLLALWLIFATTLQHSLNWLVGRYGLAAFLGAVFGPVSYYAGQQLGALQLGGSVPVTVSVLAAVWATLLPLLLLWSGRKDD